jgi:peptidoglycan/xylan/chitin deacetylase (PgdA/CDA1 family)
MDCRIAAEAHSDEDSLLAAWDDCVERIVRAARRIARGGGFDARAEPVFPPSWPELQPDFLGETLAAALRAELGGRTVGKASWERWRPDLHRLVAAVLDWPGGERVQAMALATARHRLGLAFGDGENAPDGMLSEIAFDLDGPGGDAFETGRPAAVQLRMGRHALGLVFLSGFEDAARISPAQAIVDQLGDLDPRMAARALVSSREFWAGAAGHGFARARQRGFADAARHLRRDVRHAIGAGVRAALLPRLRRAGAAGVPGERSAASRPVPVLMYHRVADEGDPALSQWRVTLAQFRQHMHWLQRSGFEPISLELMNEARLGRNDLPRRPVLITFDDGYCDFYDAAWPVLREMKFPSALFVVAGKAGGLSDWDRDAGRPEPLMTWRQLAEIAAGGVSIGSHSMMHRRFSRLSVREAYDDMQGSAALIAERLGRRPASFCYPYGAYDRLLERVLAACGYEFAFTCEPAAAWIEDNPLRLPRIEVTGSEDLDAFAAKVLAHAGHR